MTTDPHEDPILHLLERWQRGEDGAKAELVEAVQPWIQTAVRREMEPSDRDDCESLDVAQHAVLNFLEYSPRYVPESGARLRSLLRRIVKNELIDLRRKRGPGKPNRHLESLRSSGGSLASFAPVGHSGEGPQRLAEGAEEAFLVRLALHYLEPDERYLIVASEIEGSDWQTIADELGLDHANTARMRCARLKPRIANLLRQLRSGQVPEPPASESA